MMQARKRASLVFLSWNGTVNALLQKAGPKTPEKLVDWLLTKNAWSSISEISAADCEYIKHCELALEIE